MRLSVVALQLAAVLASTCAAAQEVPSPEDARSHEIMGRFDDAATALERHVAERSLTNPDAAVARAWIERAISYRIALGDEAAAARDVRELARRSTDHDHVAEVELDVAVIFERTGRWRESTRFHEDWIHRHGRDASPALRVRALAQLGDALRESGDAARAIAAYRRASQLAPPRSDDGTVDRNFDRVREPVARALFWLAEARDQALMASALPRYFGPPTRRRYDVWAERTLNPFIAEQMRAINEDLTRRYAGVVNLHVPRWKVAACERLAEVFAHFARLVHDAPPPPDIARHPELVDVMSERCEYDDACGDSRFMRIAVTGFQRCLRIATQVRWPAPTCGQQLTEIDRLRYPDADEVVPTLDVGLRR